MRWLFFALAGAGSCWALEPHPEVFAQLTAIHRAFEAYRTDHHGEYPPLAIRQDDGSLQYWPELLKPYLDDQSPEGKVDPSGVFFAPYVPMDQRRNGNPAVVSFGYNRYGLGRDAGLKTDSARFPVTDIPHSDKTILLAEVDAPNQAGAGWYASWPDPLLDYARYEGQSHVLFASGRVALLTPAELSAAKPADSDEEPWFGGLSQ